MKAYWLAVLSLNDDQIAEGKKITVRQIIVALANP